MDALAGGAGPLDGISEDGTEDSDALDEVDDSEVLSDEELELELDEEDEETSSLDDDDDDDELDELEDDLLDARLTFYLVTISGSGTTYSLLDELLIETGWLTLLIDTEADPEGPEEPLSLRPLSPWSLPLCGAGGSLFPPLGRIEGSCRRASETCWNEGCEYGAQL